MPVTIIAEAGVNHNGDLETAKRMAYVAKECGADIVKYQTAVPELVVSRFAEKAEYQKQTTDAAESQLEMIRKLNREYGMTVLNITHYMNEAAMCDRVVVINDGQIQLDGKPKEVFTHVSELQMIGLDVPQTAELLYELDLAGVRESGKHLPLDALSVADCADRIMELYGAIKK